MGLLGYTPSEQTNLLLILLPGRCTTHPHHSSAILHSFGSWKGSSVFDSARALWTDTMTHRNPVFSRWDYMAILSRCSLLVSGVRWKNPHPALGFTGKWRHKPLPHFLVSVISIPYASEKTQILGSFILCFAIFPCLITMVIPQLWFTMWMTKTFRH